MAAPETKRSERSEFLDAVLKGALIGAAILVVVVPPMRKASQPKPAVVAVQPPAAPPSAAPPQAEAPSFGTGPLRLADFKGEPASEELRLVANWAVHTRDSKNHSMVFVDKVNARVYLFSPDGKLQASTPALLGAAKGDHTVPGIGDKPLSAVKPDEKTTPTGRFVAELGVNTGGEDIVWVDYEAAVSMHRVRPKVKAERRLERLASPTSADNRISFGCINLPVAFYEKQLKPAVQSTGAVIYVLPEVRTPEDVFKAWDVTDMAMQAKHSRPQQMAAATQVSLKREARGLRD